MKTFLAIVLILSAAMAFLIGWIAEDYRAALLKCQEKQSLETCIHSLG